MIPWKMLINENALALIYVDLFPSPANLNFYIIFPLFIKSFSRIFFLFALEQIKTVRFYGVSTYSLQHTAINQPWMLSDSGN